MTLLEKKENIIREVIKPAFKKAGFTTSAATFQKQEEDFIKIFNVQSSGTNGSDIARFYFNIGIVFPMTFEFWFKRPMPDRPKEYQCQARMRSEDLTGRDPWYELNNETNYESYSEFVRSDIENFIIPFFEELKSLDDCLSLYKKFSEKVADFTVDVGLTFATRGELHKAEIILSEYINKKGRDHELGERIITEAALRGVKL